MKGVFLIGFIFFVCVLNAQPTLVKQVIIIGVDGLSPDGIIHAHTPNIDSLMAQGSSTFECKAQMPTVSSPNWASVINGASPSAHGIWSNSWKLKQIKDSIYCYGKKGQMFPTIFRVLREQKHHAQIVIFSAWWSFVRLVEPRVCNVKERTLFTNLTAQRAVTAIRFRQPDLLFLHFDEVDEAGHKYGHGTPQYYEAVSSVDKAIGKIVKSVKSAGIENSTVIMLIADHGGIGKGHGGSTPQEINVPYLMKGPGVKRGYHLKGHPRNFDTTATIAKILGLKTPNCWEGLPIEEIFNETR